jgi:methyltransferase (TIGR00027 family)
VTRIPNVSDTARWAAYYRAMETERHDRLFRDRYAARLAGEQDDAVVATLRSGRQMAWAMIVRTHTFDEIIIDRVKYGDVDLVLNLAAGLDARPWRMQQLPPTLSWVDVDLPGILDYKLAMLAGETTVCRYDAVPVDLTDGPKRRALFTQVAQDAKRVLVVAEGLLIYLRPEQVGELANDLHALPNFQWWLVDLIGPRLLAKVARAWGKQRVAGTLPFHFAPVEGTKFFEGFGWREAEFRSSMEEGQRLKRERPTMWFSRLIGRLSPKKRQAELRRMAGFVLLER